MRKSKMVAITDGSRETNRDFGKRFLLTEMSASRVERWATRAFMAMARSGVDIPPEVVQTGMIGIAVLGLRALAMGGVHYDEVEPLLDEMLECVRIIEDVQHPELARPLIEDQVGAEDDIQEVSTRIFLRQEVFDLHVGFFQPGGRSTTTSTSDQKSPG